MLYNNNGTWTAYKYKLVYTATDYGDFADGYPPDTEVTSVLLSPEQEGRLEEIQGIDMPEQDAIAYVRDGVGTLPDQRTDTDILLSHIPEERLFDVIDIIPSWQPATHYLRDTFCTLDGQIYRVRQGHTSLEHQPPDAEGMGAIYLPCNPPGVIVDYDPNRNLAANPYQVGELVRFPYGVYEAVRVTNFSPQEYAPDWLKRDDLT